MTKLIVSVAMIGLAALGAVVITSPKEKGMLNVEVLEGKVLSETSDTLVLFAPAKYKVVRAAYDDDCFYNRTGTTIYGSGEDVIKVDEVDVVSAKAAYTYRITCQPLIGRGERTTYAKTVIVLQPAEIHSAEVTLTSSR